MIHSPSISNQVETIPFGVLLTAIVLQKFTATSHWYYFSFRNHLHNKPKWKTHTKSRVSSAHTNYEFKLSQTKQETTDYVTNEEKYLSNI